MNSVEGVFELRHTVVASEIDRLGHVNNLAYVQWMQNAAVAHSTAQGWPTSRYLATGAGWVVRSHAIEYLSPGFLGDEILVRTWIADFKRISSLRRYRILRLGDEALLARAETNWVYVGFEKGIPRRVPPEVTDCFTVVPE